MTLMSLITGIWMFVISGSEHPRLLTALTMHLVAGFVGVYLVLFHVVGYFACRAVQADRMAEPRRQLSDTGWVMMGLMLVSLLSGMALWQSWLNDVNLIRFARVLHVGVAVCYIALSATHFHYYWNVWKPALRQKSVEEA